MTTTAPMMSSQEAADLCMALMRADTEAEVVAILRAKRLWDDPGAWRLFSDNDNAFSVIGNQQAEAVAAFIEKIVNSVDARLIDACRLADCDPEGPDAPQSMREAVARLFEGTAQPTEKDGRISEWDSDLANSEAKKLTVAATGLGHHSKPGQPSLTVADQGEGQTPDEFPNTFMSIQRNNKLRTPFVQGKFNMGGTGALQFSKFQLVVSRRNPAFVGADASDRDHQWGFTILRRDPPPEGARSSVFRYLAPVPLPDGSRGVLSFSADVWPIFPEATKDIRDAYCRMVPYGSLVKLYEYTWQGVKSNIVQSGDGLLRRIDVGLPELALPVRVYECRPEYVGHAGSFQTSALGLISRLDRDRESNLETEEPIGGIIALDDGKQIKLRVYVFRDADKAKNYRNRRQGVVFGLNGQMHAAYPVEFFTRTRVNLGYLKDSLLVFVDCSAIEGQTREDLFMNSRDRLRDSQLSRTLEAKLENFLHNESTLRALQNQRRQDQIQNRLKDDKPLGDVLKGLMKANPTLSRLFLQGLQLSAPFPPGDGSGGGHKGTAGKFVGKRFPSYFRFKDRADGEAHVRIARLGSKVHVTFETDAEDSYFSREVEAGAWNVRRKVDGRYIDAGGWNTSGPRSGVAQLWFDSLPNDAKIGDCIEYLIEVTDPSRIESFQVSLILTVQAPAESGGGGGGGRSRNHNTGKGDGGGAGSNMALPTIIPMRRADWKPGDDELTALRIVHAGTPTDDEAPVYDFYLNLDNKYLLLTQKERTANADLLEKQFIYGFVLIGLALIHEHNRRTKDRIDGTTTEAIDEYVARTTRALSPVLLPIIEAIGALDA